MQYERDIYKTILKIPFLISGIKYASSTPLTYLLEQGFQLDISDASQAIHSVTLPPMPSLVDDVQGVKDKIKVSNYDSNLVN